MAELKAGGLAMVVGGSPELIGFTVRTERMIMPGQQFAAPNGILSANDVVRPKWLCSDERITVRLSDGRQSDGWALFCIEHLMPIDGDDFINEDERQKELAHG